MTKGYGPSLCHCLTFHVTVWEWWWKGPIHARRRWCVGQRLIGTEESRQKVLLNSKTHPCSPLWFSRASSQILRPHPLHTVFSMWPSLQPGFPEYFPADSKAGAQLPPKCKDFPWSIFRAFCAQPCLHKPCALPTRN